MAPNKLRIAIATYSNVQARLFGFEIQAPVIKGRKLSPGTQFHGNVGRDLTREREVAWWRLFMMDTPRPAGVEGQPLLLPPKTSIPVRS